MLCKVLKTPPLSTSDTLTPSAKAIKKHLTLNGESPAECGAAVPSLVCVCFHSLFVCLLLCCCTCSADMQGREKGSGCQESIYGHRKETGDVSGTALH